jgi:hypothetical protein
VRRRIAFLAAALVAGLGVAVYRSRQLDQGEARLRDEEARSDGGGSQPSAPSVTPRPTTSSG